MFKWFRAAGYLHRSSLSLLENGVSLLEDGQLDTVALGEGHNRGLASAEEEHVLLSGGEGVAGGVSDDDNIEGAGVLLDVDDGTNTTSVTSLGDHAHVTRLKLDVVNDLAGGDVNLHHIINLDGGIRVADGAAIVGDNKRDLLQGELSTLDLAKLVGLLLVGDSVKDVLALGVVDQTELIVGLGDLNDVHEASREVGVGSDLTINLDVLLNADNLGLAAGEGVLQTVSQDEDERQALSQLVGTLGRARSLRNKLTVMKMTMIHWTKGLTQIPSILDSIQCLGAFKRFKCILGPRAYE